MELVTGYLFQRYVPKRDPLPFPQYLLPENKWNNSFWITKEGECVHPWEMSNRHLIFTIQLIHRKNYKLSSRYEECHADNYILTGIQVYEEYESAKKEMSKKGRKRGIPYDILTYFDLWTEYRLYMLLRREIKYRGLEEQI